MVKKVSAIQEIDIHSALRLVKSNKSIFVWIGGWATKPLADLLEIDGNKVVDADPVELLDNFPKELLNEGTPIFVGHTGATSLELVKGLQAKGVESFSLQGGIEGIKKV